MHPNLSKNSPINTESNTDPKFFRLFVLGVEGDIAFFEIIVWKIGECDFDGIQDEHQTGDCAFEVCPHRGVEDVGCGVGVCFCDAEI